MTTLMDSYEELKELVREVLRSPRKFEERRGKLYYRFEIDNELRNQLIEVVGQVTKKKVR